jgi:hypothetical protein
MTNTEIETQASRIRSRWLAIRDGQRTAVSADSASPASPSTKITAENFVAGLKRPLNPNDLGFIAALEADTHAPHWLKSREQRRARRRLERQIRVPDLTGLSSPDEQALKDNPDLAARWDEQIKNGAAVFNPKR